ncbi:2-amino-4-hydroxy-6-hydroxymethyldihydropteridine diphosphokinase [Rhodoferax sp.]|uniref:2-amino-4-hydroxy-6- hydroxymethyldihydropteridine diphosphokinase n=1 Tax=Rhodoferax sp. TaxID=50421 RepID=UPI002606CD72|nr:2-amino-4-hydroxy-6-hydroxymethyldihydropteridine diphosphokinase [Rhodoferax sp.]MDD2918069.1 2-amino-4-hydroxy-6-hydroxymethyldihydropteridine diphosphokinase [Rhodoferax sp.]
MNTVVANPERPEVLAYVALGANLGAAQATVLAAMQSVAALPQTRFIASSSLYRTAPLDAAGPDFINAVVAVSTRLSAPELLLHLQRLEIGAGRERPYRNAPRTLDLDILLYGDASITSPTLQVPHPRMWQRAFVLVPLAEIAPAKVSSPQLQAVASQEIERLV